MHPKHAAKMRQRCGKVGTQSAAKMRQRCGKDAAKMRQRCGKMRQRCCKDAVQFQTASGNVAKWVTILIASSGHERNWDIPKNASRISQTTARTDSWTPHSNGITTATAAHTSQTHMDLDASPFQLNLFFTSQGCCSGSEPSSFSLASLQGQEMCRIAADSLKKFSGANSLLKCQMARRRRLVFLACWIQV